MFLDHTIKHTHTLPEGLSLKEHCIHNTQQKQRDGHIYPQWATNPRYQESSGCRSTPYPERPTWSVPHHLPCINYTSMANISYSSAFKAINEYTLLIYNLTNDCTIISNTIITNNMLLHVSTFKMSFSGSHCALLKLHTDFLFLVKESY